MIPRIAAFIARHHLFGPTDRIAVTVSGGADSVCLLHLLREAYPEQALLVVHINHLLRGAESEADEAFVRRLAAALGLPCEVEQIEVGALAGNLEENAREARLASFRRLVESGRADKVATGHTASDQAETVLFRLLRGTGGTGLSGIRPATEWGSSALSSRSPGTKSGIGFVSAISNGERTVRTRIRPFPGTGSVTA